MRWQIWNLLKVTTIKTSRKQKLYFGCFNSFPNPFKVDNKEHLYCLASTSKEIIDDLLKTDTSGEASFSSFVNKVFVQKESSFHNPLKKRNLMTFTNMRKKMNLKACTKKFLNFWLLNKTYLDLENVLSSNPVSRCRAIADGAPVKADKLKLFIF